MDRLKKGERKLEERALKESEREIVDRVRKRDRHKRMREREREGERRRERERGESEEGGKRE